MEFKIDYINDIYWPLKKCILADIILVKKWIAAINRFRTVVDDYDTTIYGGSFTRWLRFIILLVSPMRLKNMQNF